MRLLQKKIKFPNDDDPVSAINYNVIGNCRFNRRDICIANKIHGKCVAELKGKSANRKTKMKRADMKFKVARAIIDSYGKIHLDINIMYINKITFLLPS